MRARIYVAALLLTSLAFVGHSLAAEDTSKSVTIQATIGSKAVLSLGGATNIVFSDTGDATTVTDFTAAATTVNAKVRTGINANPSLTVSPDKDEFTNADGAKIPVSAVTWTGSDDLIGGALVDSITDVAVNGAWLGSSEYTGNMVFKLANSWTYSAGVYDTVTIAYTLTSP